MRSSLSPEEQRHRRIQAEDAEKAEREKLAAEKGAQHVMRALLATIGRYAGCELVNFEIYDRRVQESRQSSVRDSVRGIMKTMPDVIRKANPISFVGPCGTGKDHLMAAMAKCAVRISPVTWLWGRQVASFVEPFAKSKVTSRDLPEGVICVSDPIEREDLYPSDRPAFGTLVDLCYTFKRPLWVTLNATSSCDAEDKYGTRVMDRLGHDGTFFMCDWESYRGRKK